MPSWHPGATTGAIGRPGEKGITMATYGPDNWTKQHDASTKAAQAANAEEAAARDAKTAKLRAARLAAEAAAPVVQKAEVKRSGSRTR